MNEREKGRGRVYLLFIFSCFFPTDHIAVSTFFRFSAILSISCSSMNANQIATRCSCSTSAAPCASLRASRGAAEARGSHQSRANLIDRRRQRRYELRDSLVARAAEGEEKPQAPAGISEDVLARLRAAESEAAMLREQLAKVQVRRRRRSNAWRIG